MTNHFEKTPDEILLYLFSFLDYPSIVMTSATCSRFHNIVLKDFMKRDILSESFNENQMIHLDTFAPETECTQSYAEMKEIAEYFTSFQKLPKKHRLLLKSSLHYRYFEVIDWLLLHRIRYVLTPNGDEQWDINSEELKIMSDSAIKYYGYSMNEMISFVEKITGHRKESNDWKDIYLDVCFNSFKLPVSIIINDNWKSVPCVKYHKEYTMEYIDNLKEKKFKYVYKSFL